mgnify:CR=1 FL=1
MQFILSNGEVLNYEVIMDNCCVYNSYKIKKKKLKLEFIRHLRLAYPAFNIRSEYSYYCE